MAKTMPIAMALVTYGMKKIVWKSFFSAGMLFRPMAMSREMMTERGTVMTVKSNVLGRAVRMTRSK